MYWTNWIDWTGWKVKREDIRRERKKVDMLPCDSQTVKEFIDIVWLRNWPSVVICPTR